MSSWFQDDRGNQSMGRLLAFWATAAGTIIVVVGLVLVFIEILRQLGSSQGVALTGIGAGIMGAGNGAKAFGKRYEA